MMGLCQFLSDSNQPAEVIDKYSKFLPKLISKANNDWQENEQECYAFYASSDIESKVGVYFKIKNEKCIQLTTKCNW